MTPVDPTSRYHFCYHGGVNAARSLRYARRHARLSQRELADRSGMPQPALARIESGRVTPRLDTMSRLLEACGYAIEIVPSAALDRSAIRRLLRLTPRQRLDLAVTEAGNLDRLLRR